MGEYAHYKTYCRQGESDSTVMLGIVIISMCVFWAVAAVIAVIVF